MSCQWPLLFAVAAQFVQLQASQPGSVASIIRASLNVHVHQSVQERMFLHGGVEVRGMSTKEHLPSSTTVVRIPKEMWITDQEVPEIAKLDIVAMPECHSMDASVAKQAIALFFVGRNASDPRSVYVKSLPALADFQKNIPCFADDAVLLEFAGLTDFVEAVTEERDLTKESIDCFSAIKKRLAIMEPMTADDFLHFAMVAYTRRFAVGENSSALIPVADLFNTANEDEVNVEWEVKDDVLLFETASSVHPGKELYQTYCRHCNNAEMLLSWGVYLEGNPNKYDGTAHCGNSTAVIVKRILGDFNSGSTGCMVQDVQRCNFALLALEACGNEWSSKKELQRDTEEVKQLRYSKKEDRVDITDIMSRRMKTKRGAKRETKKETKKDTKKDTKKGTKKARKEGPKKATKKGRGKEVKKETATTTTTSSNLLV